MRTSNVVKGTSGRPEIAQAFGTLAPLVGEAVSADALLSAERSSPQVAPDGTRLAYLPAGDGAASIWLRSLDGRVDRPLVAGRQRGLEELQWSADGRWILYMQDEGGDENWRLPAVDRRVGHPVRDRELLFENEGHHYLGLRESRDAFYAAVERFLERHLS